MDIVEPILGIAEKLYALCGQVKANKKRCKRLADRVHALEDIVKSVKVNGLGKEPESVRRGLEELKCTLERAQEVVKKYTSTNFLKRVVRAYDLDEEFESLNTSLNETFQLLSLALQIEQRETLAGMFAKARREEEDKADRTGDHKDLDKLSGKMDAVQDGVDSVKEGVDSVKNEMRDIKNLLKQQSLSLDTPDGGGAAVKSGGGAMSRSSSVEGQHFVDKNQMELIKRITSVSPILDHLRVKNIISGEMYGQIMSERTPANQMRKLLYDVILTHGERAKDELVAILEMEQPYLMDTLRG